jgi:hypothetical protein
MKDVDFIINSIHEKAQEYPKKLTVQIVDDGKHTNFSYDTKGFKIYEIIGLLNVAAINATLNVYKK